MKPIIMKNAMKSMLDTDTYALVIRAGLFADKQGVKAYIVGGMVRDIFLKRNTVDIDIVIQGDGMKFARLFADELHAAYKVFEKFKTAKIYLENTRIDISSARKEYYKKPAALPDVEPSGMDEDLFRRDFTINSMAVSINEKDFGAFFDPFNGAYDLKNKILRTMHDKSFIDDPTRILRAIRFETRLGFRIEKRTLGFIHETLKHNVFGDLSGERIREELFILFQEPFPEKAMQRLECLGVLKKISAGLKFDTAAAKMFKKTRVLKKLMVLYGANPEIISLMVLFGSITPAAAGEAVLKLKLSNEQSKAIVQAKELQIFSKKGPVKTGKTRSGIYFLFKKYGTEALLYLMLLQKDKKQAAKIRLFLDELRHVKIEITGRDLLEMGVKEGPKYAEILDKLMEAKLDGKAKTKEEQKILVKKLIEM
jgi:tRNA nucleotidyltransferase (CCA-adding enzyme)